MIRETEPVIDDTLAGYFSWAVVQHRPDGTSFLTALFVLASDAHTHYARVAGGLTDQDVPSYEVVALDRVRVDVTGRVVQRDVLTEHPYDES